MTVSRRIFVYWILLLVPTLIVGAAAIFLLQRERDRLAQQGAYADEARRAAITSRARLIAENVELLVGDVQTGLLDALAEAPAATLDAALDEWERANPLVRTAFRAAMNGRLLRPNAVAGGEEGRAFVRRFATLLLERPPWSSGQSLAAVAPAPAELKRQKEELVARKEVASNVAQVQNARRDVQELFKSTDLAANYAAPAAASAPAPSMAERSRQKSSVEADRASESRVSGLAVSDARSVLAQNRSQALAGKLKDAAPARRGWWTQGVDGRTHVLGWVLPEGNAGEVRGVEVETAALLSRLTASLPGDVEVAEGYALRDANGRTVHQTGAVSRTTEPVVRIPLAVELLPNWDVVGYFSTPVYGREMGGGFFGLGMLLVAIFVAAIIAGGSLLGWQARRSEEEATHKTSFVANVSHEFKTPLTTIRLYSELLEQGRVRDADQGRDYLRTIGRETQRLARLVNNALDFSRLEQGRKKYARETIDLGAEIGRLVETHAPRVADAGFKLHCAVPTAQVSVSVDRDALEQIVLNLIDNACKYASDGGEIQVSVCARPDDGGEVRVSDRGPGVPLPHRERIFEKFQRVDDTLTAEKSGAGLGLSIARQLARGLGGELRYAPREGGGAEFVLELR